MSKIPFEFGEVITPTTNIKTYSDDMSMDERRFSISVKLWTNIATEPVSAKPANLSDLRIPLIGEHVIVFKGTNQYSTNAVHEDVWYYLPAYSIFGNVNENTLPGIAGLRTQTIDTVSILDRDELSLTETFGETFTDEIVPAIQPYEGDTINQGRFGNIIRLGSTVTGLGSYSTKPYWGGDKGGDPIITISNNSKRGSTKFRTENLITDDSSIYLTSTQTIPISLNKAIKHTSPISTYKNSQLIGSAGRIILQAKDDSIILDAKKRITLNADKTYIGSENATIPLVDSIVLLSILEQLLDALSLQGYTSTGGSWSFVDIDKINSLKLILKNIKSEKHKMDK